MTHDVVVIGAGVLGSAIARELARSGTRVLLLEKAVPGAEASSAAAGILGPRVESTSDGPVFRLGLASREAHGALAEALREETGIDVGFRRCGLVKVALPGDDLDALAASYAWQASAGFPVERLSGAAVRELEPSLATEVLGGLSFPDEAQVDAQALARALPIAAERAGATVRRAAVRRILVEGERCRGVLLDDGPVHADRVVLAAGAWSAQVEGAGLAATAVRPMRGQMVRLATRSAAPSRIVFTPRGYLVPRADGTVLCGSTMELVGFDKRVTAAGVSGILANAVRTIPSLGDAELAATWAGFRPLPPDGLPLLGESATAGLFVASGHHRNGILLTPETARLLAAAVLGRRPPELAPFSPARPAAR